MIETLLISWGIKTAWSAFGPVLEDLAQDVAKDSAKSYIGKCFGSVFSSKNEKVLVKATGQTIKELLDLLEYELGLDEDTQREELVQAQRAAAAFLKQKTVREAITALLQGEQHDPAALAQAWQQVPDAPPLPDDFSWQRISKRFSRKAKEIRDSIPELKAVFAQAVAVKAHEALASDLGPQPDFDLDVYAKALQERFGRLNLDCLDTDGASYNAVRLWSVFVPQAARECEKFQPRHLELPKGDEERLEQLRPYFEQPPQPVLEVCADPQLQRLVILGDPGSGKSTLLRCLALEWARDKDATRRALAPLPLLIELRDYNQWECPSDKRQRLAKAIADSRPIKLLAGNPLLLTLMAIINRKEELPRNRARLYEKAAELLLQQWDTEAKLLSEFPGLSAEIDLRAKAAILRKVALEMQTAGSKAANLIQGEKLIKLIEEYLRDELHFDKARKAANALVDQLRERNFILCFLGGDSYGFVHRTFLEYFCAAEFVDQFEKKRSLDIDGLLALYDQHCREDEWQEVLRLICGQLDESFAGRIIEHLTGLVDLEILDKRTELPKLLLSVCCLSEVRNLRRIEKRIGADLLFKISGCFFITNEKSRFELLREFEEFDLSISVIKTIGLEWPGKDGFKFDGQIPTATDRITYYWPHFIAAIFQPLPLIIQFTKAKNTFIRKGSIEALAEYWPNNNTRNLLVHHAALDQERTIRQTALKELTICWSDDEIRQFLNERATQDDDGETRGYVFRLLGEKWPDIYTQQLLAERAVQDVNQNTRDTALYWLVNFFSDEKVYQLIETQRTVSGSAASLHGKGLSLFGEIVFYAVPDWHKLLHAGIAVGYISPRQPIPAEHIQNAAKEAGIPPDKIDEAVRSLSAHMGWDITKGSLAGKL